MGEVKLPLDPSQISSHQALGHRTGSPAPAVLPDFLPDQAGDTRLLFGHRDDAALGRPASDFEQELAPDRLFELVAILDRHHEGTWAADDAVLVIEIEVVDIHGRIG